MEDDIKLQDVLNRVEIARKIIESQNFTNEQVTQLCGYLGFNDTAFKTLPSERKLKDYLLDKNYWIERFKSNSPKE